MALDPGDLKEADLRYSNLGQMVSQPVIPGEAVLRGAVGPHFVEANAERVIAHLEMITTECEEIIDLLTEES